MTKRYTKKLMLEAYGTAPDGAGGMTGGWAAMGTHWAEVTLRSGRLERGEGAARSRASYLVRLRAVGPDQPSRPRPGQRFRDGNRVLLIRTVADARLDERVLECLTDEEVLT